MVENKPIKYRVDKDNTKKKKNFDVETIEAEEIDEFA